MNQNLTKTKPDYGVAGRNQAITGRNKLKQRRWNRVEKFWKFIAGRSPCIAGRKILKQRQVQPVLFIAGRNRTHYGPQPGNPKW